MMIAVDTVASIFGPESVLVEGARRNKGHVGTLIDNYFLTTSSPEISFDAHQAHRVRQTEGKVGEGS